MTGAASDSILIPPEMRSDDGRLLCSRVRRVREDGTLISPLRGTEWTSHCMKADRFTVNGELRGEAGLHAVWRLPGATPENPHKNEDENEDEDEDIDDDHDDNHDDFDEDDENDENEDDEEDKLQGRLITTCPNEQGRIESVRLAGQSHNQFVSRLTLGRE